MHDNTTIALLFVAEVNIFCTEITVLLVTFRSFFSINLLLNSCKHFHMRALYVYRIQLRCIHEHQSIIVASNVVVVVVVVVENDCCKK